MRHMICKVVRHQAWCLAIIAVGIACAEEPNAPFDVEKQNIEAALKLTRESAIKYEMLPGDGSQPLALRVEPILRWSNPERGQIYGNVFIWTNRGRPEVVGSLFKWFSPFTHMSHEFHSLSTGQMIGRYEDAEVWRSSQSALSFTPVHDAADVAPTPAARLTQMKQMARQFSARSIDREGLKHDLRLLAQPIYRYELDKGADSTDGALFVFVQGTDPEVWLMIEARQPTGQSNSTWQYAVARMNSIDLTVEHNGKAAWHCDIMPSKEIYGHKAAYTSFQFNRP